MNKLKKIAEVLMPVIALIVALVLSGCSAYDPNYDNTVVTPTAVVSPTKTPVTTPEGTVVTVLGNVYVRDNSGQVQGWLEAGTVVRAECNGEWCVVKNGQFNGLKFYRGCAADNPDNLGCRKAD